MGGEGVKENRLLKKTVLLFFLFALFFSSIANGILPPAKAWKVDLNDPSSTYQQWFNAKNSTGGLDKIYLPDISIPTGLDQKGTPPSIKISAGKAGRPEIFFRLSEMYTQAGTFTANQDWFYFDAFDSNGAPIPDLGLAFNDEDNVDVAIFSGGINKMLNPDEKNIYAIKPGNSYSTLVIGPGPPLSPPYDTRNNPAMRIVVNQADIQSLFGYAFDEPKDRGQENCNGLTDDQKNISKAPTTANPSGSFIQDKERARKLNSNCVNMTPEGWLSYWGLANVSVTGGSGLSGCSLISIFSLDIGQMIQKVIACVFGSILSAVVDLLSPLVQQVAELSYLPSPPILQEQTLALADSGIFLPKAYAKGTGTGTQNKGVTGLKSIEQELRKKPDDSAIVRMWVMSRSIVDVIVVVALLIIAFANILHLNINTYAAKKALPGLVVGVIGANASLLIVRFIADLTLATNQLVGQIMGGNSGTASIVLSFFSSLGRAAAAPLGVGALGAAAGSALLGVAWGTIGIAAALVAIVAIIAYLFVLIAVLWVLLKRVVIIYFLTIAAPLAFVAYGIPSFKQYFTRWWDLLLRNFFVLPILLFGMAMTIRLSDALGAATIFSGFTLSAAGMAAILMVFAAATFTIKLPSLVTKGMLDLGGAIKKVMGTAPNIVAGVQGAHSFATGGGWQAMKARNLQARANKMADGNQKTSLEQRAKALAKTADEKRQAFKSKADKYKLVRGGATIAFRPQDTVAKWYKERQEAGEKDNMRAAGGFLDGSVSGGIRGPAGAFSAAATKAKDDLQDMQTKAEFVDYLNQNSGAKALYSQLESMIARLPDDDKRIAYRARLSNASSLTDLQKIVDSLNDEKDASGNGKLFKDKELRLAGYGAQDQAKVTALYRRMSSAASRNVATRTPATTLSRQTNIFPSFPFGAPVSNPSAGAGGGAGEATGPVAGEGSFSSVAPVQNASATQPANPAAPASSQAVGSAGTATAGTTTVSAPATSVTPSTPQPATAPITALSPETIEQLADALAESFHPDQAGSNNSEVNNLLTALHATETEAPGLIAGAIDRQLDRVIGLLNLPYTPQGRARAISLAQQQMLALHGSSDQAQVREAMASLPRLIADTLRENPAEIRLETPHVTPIAQPPAPTIINQPPITVQAPITTVSPIQPPAPAPTIINNISPPPAAVPPATPEIPLPNPEPPIEPPADNEPS